MMPAAAVPHEPRLSALLAGFAEVPLALDGAVIGLSLDTRSVEPGDLFLALAGERQHGLAFVAEAVGRGAAAVAWEPVPGVKPPPALGVPAVAVEALGQRAGLIADRFFGHPSQALKVLGVTGTDGKTSVSHFIAQALHAEAAPCGVIGTLGYGAYAALSPGPYTTPDAVRVHAELDRLRGLGARACVMEVSSHALVQGRVEGVAFELAVLTNLGRDHFDYHGDRSAYAAAKRRLFEVSSLRQAVLNADDAFGRALAGQCRPTVQVLSYGTGEAAAVRGVRVEPRADGLRLEVATPWGHGRLDSALLGRFNADNLLAALATLLALHFPLDEALARLARTRAVAGRMEGFGGGEHPRAVIDYAHTPGALEQVLRALRAHCAGRLVCVFGCGGDRDPGKRAPMAAAAERHADRVIVTDDNPRTESPARIVADIRRGLKDPATITVIHDRAAAIAQALADAARGDVVLIAGKGHEAVQVFAHETRPFSDRAQVLACLGKHGA